MHCINTNLKEYKELVQRTVENEAILKAKIATWQEKNGFNKWPSLKQLFPDSYIPNSKAKAELGRNYNTQLSEKQKNILLKDIKRKNSRLKKENAGYRLQVVLRNFGETGDYKWDLFKKQGSVNLENRVNKEEMKLVDASQNVTPLEEAKKEAGDNQLSLFQKLDAATYNFLEGKYQDKYGLSFTDSFEPVQTNKKQEDLLFENFGIAVQYDSELKDDDGNFVSGAVKNGKVYINPNYQQKDTLIHEYAHILIDILGVDNPRVKAAIEKLENTKIWNETLDLYPELDPLTFRKEVLATAIGRKGSEIFEREFNQNWWQRFIDWFLTAIGIKVNKSKDEIESLVEEMFSKKKDVSTFYLNKIAQFQKFTNFKSREKLSVKTILKEASDSLEIKINRWKNRAEHDEKAESYLTNLKKFQASIEKYLRAENVHGFINIAEYVEGQLESIKNKVNSGKVNSNLLVTIDSFKGSFEFVEEINTLIRNKPEVLNPLTDKQKIDLQSKINNIIASSKNIDDDINELSKRILASKLSSIDAGYVQKMYELQAENDFNQEDRKFDNKKERAEAKKQYIEKYIEKNQDKIKNDTYNYFYNILEEGKDIKAVSKILDSGQVNSQIIQLVQKMVDREDTATGLSHMAVRAELMEEFEKIENQSNQEKMYENIQEIGENHNYLVSKYDPLIIEEYQKLLSDERNSESSEQLKEIRRQKDKWRSKYVTNGKLNEKALSKKYKNLSKKDKETLEYAKERIEKDDKNLFKMDKLQFEMFGEVFTRVPSVTKGIGERYRETSFKEATKKTLDEVINIQADDTEYGLLENDKNFTKSVFANEKGEQTQRIPVFYRNKIDKEDRSSDLFSALLANHYTAENFRNKSKISADLEILSDLLENKKYIGYQNGKSLVSKLFPKRFTKDIKKESNEQKMLRNIIENRLYSIGEIPEYLANVSVNKVSSFLNSWSSSVMLGFNYFAAVPNLLMGHTMTLSEAVAGRDIKPEDYKKATLQYWNNFNGILSDITKTNPENKISLLLDAFEVLNFGTNENTKFLDHKRTRSLMKRDKMFFFSKAAEHNIQSTLMLSVLNNTKIEGKSAYDLIEAKDGKLDTSKLSNKDFQILKSKIKKLIADNNGQYDTRMKSEIQRSWWGSMMFMFRKWIPRGITNRYQGIGNVNKRFGDFKNQEEFKTFFSQESGEFEEGYYVSFVRMVYRAFKDYKGNVFKQLNNMTDYEKSNVRRTTFEFAVTAALFGMYGIFKSMAKEADGDEEDILYTQAYWFRRTFGELAFWYNVRETLHMLRSPAASLSFAESLFDFTTEAMPITGWNQYERDSGMFEKGDYKIQKEFRDILPIGNQIFRYKEASDALSFIEMY